MPHFKGLTGLTALNGVEGSDVNFGVSFTKATDNDELYYEYRKPGETTWTKITADTKFYTVGGTATASEPGVAYDPVKDVTTFVTSESNLQIKNVRTSLNGYSFRAVAKSGIAELASNLQYVPSGDASNDGLPLTVYKANFKSFSVRPLKDLMNIGDVAKLSNTNQFVVILEYDNSTSQYMNNDSRVKFFKNPENLTIEELRSRISTEVPASDVTPVGTDTSGVQTGTATIGGSEQTVYGVLDGETTKWYYSQFTPEMLESDTYVCDEMPIVSGVNEFFAIIPDFANPTRSVVQQFSVTGVDMMPPTMDPIEANWISKNEQGEDVFEPFVLGGKVRGANFPMRLSVGNIKDNYSSYPSADAEHPAAIKLQWYKDGVDEDHKIPDATTDAIDIFPSQGQPNGVYYVVATDNDGTGKSFTQEINLSAAWDTVGPEFTMIYEPEDLSKPVPYVVATFDVSDTPENPANLADEPYAFVGPVDANISTEELYAKRDACWSIANSYTVTEPGFYYAFVKDVAGNISSFSNDGGSSVSAISITGIDNDAPVIRGIEVEPSVDDNGQVRKDTDGVPFIKIIVHADDNSTETDQNGNPIPSDLLYRLEKGDGTLVRDWQRENVFDDIKDGGDYVIYVKDAAGNISRYVINDINKNTIITDEYLTQLLGVKVTSNNNKYWTNQPITITLEATNPSALDPTAPFSYNGGAWTSSTTYEIRENGVFTLSVKDVYGQEHPYTNITIECIDMVAPEFTATPSGKNNTITVNAVDDPDGVNGSGLAEIFYYVDGVKRVLTAFNENTHTSQPQTILVEKNGTYDIWVKDKAGNVTNKPIEITSVMPDNPLFEGSEDEIAAKITAKITANPTTWTNNNVTLSFTPESMQSFANNPYSWDGGANWISSQNYTAIANGDYVLNVKDMYGNIYHSNVISVNNIDKIAPTLDAQQQGNNLVITSSDVQSGVASISWVGGPNLVATPIQNFTGGQQSVNCVVELPSNGSYTLYAVDEAGNTNSITKTVSGVVPKDNGNNTNSGNNSNNNANTGNTVEKYYYNTTVEKNTPVYVDKYVGGSTTSSGSSYSTPQPQYVYPTQVPTTTTRTTAVTPTPAPTKAPTTTPTPTPAATKAGSSAKTTTTSSTVTKATTKPSSTAKKVTTEVVAASPVKTSEEEDVEVLDKENAAKYRNSRVAGSVNATGDNKGAKGINIVLGIVGSLIALSGIAAGVYWYTAKYKPALIDGELSKDDYAFAEDIAMAQSEDGEQT